MSHARAHTHAHARTRTHAHARAHPRNSARSLTSRSLRPAAPRARRAGSVDDPRNTDNAWLETTVYLFVITDDAIATSLKLVGGDDASHARWLTIDGSLMSTLYADHFTFVQRALQALTAA
jgi:hypothetical protein